MQNNSSVGVPIYSYKKKIFYVLIYFVLIGVVYAFLINLFVSDKLLKELFFNSIFGVSVFVLVFIWFMKSISKPDTFLLNNSLTSDVFDKYNINLKYIIKFVISLIILIVTYFLTGVGNYYYDFLEYNRVKDSYFQSIQSCTKSKGSLFSTEYVCNGSGPIPWNKNNCISIRNNSQYINIKGFDKSGVTLNYCDITFFPRSCTLAQITCYYRSH